MHSSIPLPLPGKPPSFPGKSPPLPGKSLAVKAKTPGNLLRGEGKEEEEADGGGVEGVVLSVGGAEAEAAMSLSSSICWRRFDFVNFTLHRLTNYHKLLSLNSIICY